MLVLMLVPELVANPDPVLPEVVLEWPPAPDVVDEEPLLHPTIPRSRPSGAAKRILELMTVKGYRVLSRPSYELGLVDLIGTVLESSNAATNEGSTASLLQMVRDSRSRTCSSGVCVSRGVDSRREIEPPDGGDMRIRIVVDYMSGEERAGLA